MTFLKSSKKSDQSLSDRFIEGLKKYNITYDEIINSGWKYILECISRPLQHSLKYLECAPESPPIYFQPLLMILIDSFLI